MAAPTKEMKFCKANFNITENTEERHFHFERIEGEKSGYVVSFDDYPTLREACAWVVKCEETPNGDQPAPIYLDGNDLSLASIVAMAPNKDIVLAGKEMTETKADPNYDRGMIHECAAKFRTDKITHGYLPLYEEHLPERIDSLLEIGCYKGNSLRMWRELMPDTKLTTLDLFEEFKEPKDIPNLACFKGNQMFQDVLDDVARASNYDVVIDDGSHGSKDQWMVLDTFLKPGTMVVIEDLHCCQEAFWRQGLTFEETILGQMKAGTFPFKHKLFEVKKGSIIVFVYAD